jgi:hypothetical protein
MTPNGKFLECGGRGRSPATPLLLTKTACPLSSAERCQPQASQPQASQSQASQSQTGLPQTGQSQAGQSQTGQPQAGLPQAGQSQTGLPQAGQSQAGGLTDFSRWLSEAWRATPPDDDRINFAPRRGARCVPLKSGIPPGCIFLCVLFPVVSVATRPQPPAKIWQASGLPQQPRICPQASSTQKPAFMANRRLARYVPHFDANQSHSN